MNTLLLTFDLEQFVTPEEKGMNLSRKELFSLSNQGLEKIHQILLETGTKATFFTTLEFAQQSPLLKKIAEEGHEIALHGYDHNTHYTEMETNAAEEELKKAKEGLEKLFKTKIKGFRAPQMKILNNTILHNIGISYDSSLHPTYIPRYSNNFFKTRNIHTSHQVKVIPVSVTPLIRLPFSWIWFRNFGLTYAKLCTKLTLLNQNYINIYFHPWDFAELNKEPFKGKIFSLILRNTGIKIAKELKNYITWTQEQGITATTISDYLHP